ncbi:MAG: DUF421 domain-containing protein [Lysobacter sp.]|nr:DUF421 domain-containing protein [Lysobacter sp.]
MEAVLRGAAIYLFLMLVFRISSKRPLSEMTAFDLVLLLIIGESASQGLMGDDFSVINAFVLIATLVTVERGFALLKQKSESGSRWLDDVPLILVDKGKLPQERMDKSHVSRDDILEAARALHVLETMRQIRYAVLERAGSISVIPHQSPWPQLPATAAPGACGACPHARRRRPARLA